MTSSRTRLTQAKDSVINSALRKLGVNTTETMSLAVIPDSFREDVIQYWNWFVLEKASSTLTFRSTPHTLLNHILAFWFFMNSLGYRILHRGVSLNIESLSSTVFNDIASRQASTLNNLLVRSKLPRKLMFVRHRIVKVDVSSINSDLFAASRFHICGTIEYRARKTGMIYDAIRSLSGGLYDKGVLTQLLSPSKLVSGDRLASNHNSALDAWSVLFDWSGVSLDIARSKDHKIFFRYFVTVDACLFSSTTTAVMSNTTKKAKRLWLQHFFPN